MPDLQDPSAADVNQQQTRSETGEAPSPGADHLASLYTMSTTSAAAATEYTAINPTSVVALLLGLASVVALLETLLLIVPALAVVVGLAAMSQIRKSNGTQTGRGLALAGIGLGLLLGATVGVREVVNGIRTREDKQQIAAALAALGQKVNAGEYDAAYAMFTPQFQKTFPRDKFVETWTQLQASPEAGRIQWIRWNGRATFEKTAGGGTVAGAGSDWKWERLDQLLWYQVVLHESGGQWQIDGIPTIFKAPRRPRSGQTADEAEQSDM